MVVVAEEEVAVAAEEVELDTLDIVITTTLADVVAAVDMGSMVLEMTEWAIEG